jgi:hypothetical protein
MHNQVNGLGRHRLKRVRTQRPPGEIVDLDVVGSSPITRPNFSEAAMAKHADGPPSGRKGFGYRQARDSGMPWQLIAPYQRALAEAELTAREQGRRKERAAIENWKSIMPDPGACQLRTRSALARSLIRDPKLRRDVQIVEAARAAGWIE